MVWIQLLAHKVLKYSVGRNWRICQGKFKICLSLLNVLFHKLTMMHCWTQDTVFNLPLILLCCTSRSFMLILILRNQNLWQFCPKISGTSIPWQFCNFFFSVQLLPLATETDQYFVFSNMLMIVQSADQNIF